MERGDLGMREGEEDGARQKRRERDKGGEKKRDREVERDRRREECWKTARRRERNTWPGEELAGKRLNMTSVTGL